jgi:hypothetical protein
MNTSNWLDANTLILALLLVLGGILALTLALIIYILWRIRRINLPPGADIVTTLRLTPLVVVVVLDLLDLGLDIFSAPITWVLLTRLGLAPLRLIAVIKDLIPFADVIPAMTLAWLVVRVLKPQPIYLHQPFVEPPLIASPRRPTHK